MFTEAETVSGSSGNSTSCTAATTMRPRFGREYHRPDRRHLVDATPPPPASASSSASASSVFTFDVGSVASSSSRLSDCSTDTESPRSPPHVYMNICFARRSGSPVILDPVPPPLTSATSTATDNAALLNYAEIDLSGGNASSSSSTSRHRSSTGRVEYAMIDMVATTAAARAGKEHARQREDSSRRRQQQHRSKATKYSA